jgi:hypothetical protein
VEYDQSNRYFCPPPRGVVGNLVPVEIDGIVIVIVIVSSSSARDLIRVRATDVDDEDSSYMRSPCDVDVVRVRMRYRRRRHVVIDVVDVASAASPAATTRRVHMRRQFALVEKRHIFIVWRLNGW